MSISLQVMILCTAHSLLWLYAYSNIYRPMAKFEKRLEARKLRGQGLSILRIAQQVGVSKSTASVWCEDLKLTKKQQEVLIRNSLNGRLRGSLKGAETNRKKKLERIKFYLSEGEKEIVNLSDRDFLMAGLGLYWGEGAKSGRLSLINSDPVVIAFMYAWFQTVFQVQKEDFMPRIFINEMHHSRIKEVVTFWSRLLSLPAKQFGNPTFLKSKAKKIYENYDSYYGVLALQVRKGTELRYRILGLIGAMGKAKYVGVAQLVRASHS